MEKLVITGGIPLFGEIKVAGAKNAALPILFATLLLSEPTILRNVPYLKDISTSLEVLRIMGLELIRHPNSEIEVKSSQAHTHYAPYELVKTMRASVLTLGPLLARYGKAVVSLPGGCAIGSRPIDVHLKGLRSLGAEIEIKDGYINAEVKGRLKGAHLLLDKISVTGTENLLMAAVLAEGKTVIKNAAIEPEIGDLANFLNRVGAKIQGIGTDTLEIDGVMQLYGGDYSILPDRIEAGTYLIAAVMTHGQVKLTGISPDILHSILLKLAEAGAEIQLGADWVQINMQNRHLRSVDVVTAPYPAVATDIQAQLMAMNTIANGVATITETIFENRFMHANELQRMGADIRLQGNVAVCVGKEHLSGAQVMATDLRASAGLVLAGLAAKGKTIVDRIYHLDRGYESMENKLTQLGAQIERVQ